jgi:hypothetical protein
MIHGRPIPRREFLGNFSRLSFATWLGLEFLSELEEARATSAKLTESAPASTRRGILQLRLQAFRLGELQEFFAEKIGFDVELSEDRLLVQAGGTLIQFDEISEKDFALMDPPITTSLGLSPKANSPKLRHGLPIGRSFYEMLMAETNSIFVVQIATPSILPILWLTYWNSLPVMTYPTNPQEILTLLIFSMLIILA